MRLQLIACASPNYLDQHGVPVTRMDLVNHACIGSRRPNTGRVIPWEFNVDGIAEYEPVHVSFCTNDVGTELQAALAGMGIGMIDGIIAAPHLRNGELVPLFCSSISERCAIFSIMLISLTCLGASSASLSTRPCILNSRPTVSVLMKNSFQLCIWDT